MPMYKFAVSDGGRSRLQDVDGTDLANDMAAREHALQVMKELKQNNESRWKNWKIEITEGGRRVIDIPFS
jgi:hypothetical protein